MTATGRSGIATVLLWMVVVGRLAGQSLSGTGVQPAAPAGPHPAAVQSDTSARFTVRQGDGATVLLEWQPVPGAQAYRLEGTGLPEHGVAITTTSLTVPGVEPGQATWRVTPIFSGDGPAWRATSTATVIVEGDSGATKNSGASN
jgi:hypothetical protein